MKPDSRRRLLTNAVQAAAIEIAKDADAARYPPPVTTPKPTPQEIKAFCARGPISPRDADEDELWSAAAISPDGKRHWGLGRTAGEAKASAWAFSHWPGGTGRVRVEISTEIPDGWTFELLGPPAKPRPRMFAIDPHEIFARVQLKIEDATVEEIEEAIMKSLPYMGGARQ